MSEVPWLVMSLGAGYVLGAKAWLARGSRGSTAGWHRVREERDASFGCDRNAQQDDTPDARPWLPLGDALVGIGDRGAGARHQAWLAAILT